MEDKEKEYLDHFEQDLHTKLFQLLTSKQRIGERMPQMPDIEDLFQTLATSYLQDGVREFSAYPLVSLGWMMYIGMAVAHAWDADWENFCKQPDAYLSLRDKRGYDCMDEYIREDVLKLKGTDYDNEEKLVQECAGIVHSHLRHERIEPSTPRAFHAYVRCLRQLYLHGAATELHRIGYKMMKID